MCLYGNLADEKSQIGIWDYIFLCLAYYACHQVADWYNAMAILD